MFTNYTNYPFVYPVGSGGKGGRKTSCKFKIGSYGCPLLPHAILLRDINIARFRCAECCTFNPKSIQRGDIKT